MRKTVTYLFPDFNNAANCKVYQDRTSQITGYYFTRDSLNDILKLVGSKSYGIYFLFDDSEGDENRVYVGKSSNGAIRIQGHVKNKEFWTYCILFTTDNNSFDALSIDYLEYEFIRKFQRSSYIIVNKDLRSKEPNVSIYDRPNLEASIRQIEFLLSTEGVVVEEDSKMNSRIKYYNASRNCKARIFVKNGNFVLEKGSEIKRPPETSKKWKGEYHYKRYNKIIDEYFDDGKVIESNGKIITTVNISYKRPSTAADLVSGYSENGWIFFKGLDEMRGR